MPLVAACMLAAVAPSSAAVTPPARLATRVATVSLPTTPAGRQARWLVGAVTHGPIPTAAVRAHFDQAFLAQVTPTALNASLKGVNSLRLDAITASTPDALTFLATVNGTTMLRVSIAVDAQGLIGGLLLRPAGAAPPPAPPAPATWAGVDRQIRSVAPTVRFLVAAVTGTTCRPLQALDATTPAPLASAFKLYVLDALARAIAAGTVSWSQELTITGQTRSLLGGILQDEPTGTRLSVQQVASDMISLSDNTATDMLIALVGRGAVEEATRAAGMADPARDMPFLTTREMAVLKLDHWPTLAARYLALDPAGRRALLAGAVDHASLRALPPVWTMPRDINTLEWFASPTDLCHVYASLAALARQPKLAPVARILALNAGGLSLSPNHWRSVWYKGGSEPGVLTLSYLATTRSGRTYVVSALAENPSAPLAPTAAPTLIRAMTGAFALAGR